MPWAPETSTGHVVLSPGVQACVQTCNAAAWYKWQFIDMHCVLSVQGSKTAPVHGVPLGASCVAGASGLWVVEWLLQAARSNESTTHMERMTES
jgi:hypothetical protein